MLSIEDIKSLMKEMDASSISEMKLESQETKLVLRKARPIAQAPVPQAVQPQVQVVQQPRTLDKAPEDRADAGDAQADTSLHQITAPMVGTFYASSSPEADPFVKKGSRVDKDTVVCIVEAMKLFNEIEAEVRGTIVDVLVEDGQLVEYGQPLFLVKED